MKFNPAAVTLGLCAATSLLLPQAVRADGTLHYGSVAHSHAHATWHHHGPRWAGRGWRNSRGHWVLELPIAIGSPMGGAPVVYYGGGYLPGYGAAFPYYSGGYDPGYGCSLEYHFENGFCYPN